MFVVLKTGGCTTGTGVEVTEKAEIGGNDIWGQRPLPSIFLFSDYDVSQELGTGGGLIWPTCHCLRGSVINKNFTVP